MKRLSTLFLIAMLLALPVFAAGCSSTEIEFDRDNSVRVEFVLEGGTYKNSPANIVYYYKFERGTRNKIKNPAAEKESDRFGKATVVRDEFELDGWYMTRNDDDGYVTYSEPWDFDRDKVDQKGVTLYAKWNPLIHYTYRLYRQDTGTSIGTAYEVNAGDKFKDYKAYATSVAGFTFVGFYDEDGEPWDPDFTHPGGETDTEIKVFVKLERGVFREVSTKEELLNQISINNNAGQTAAHRDIKLTADIDLEGEEFDGFRNFKRMLIGNGHTISNFKLNYPNTNANLSYDPIFDIDGGTLQISLFGMCDNAVVRDVTFDNVSIEINNRSYLTKKIVVAPLAVKSTNSTFENVNVKATYTVAEDGLPDGIAEDMSNLVTVTDKGYFYKDDASTFDNVIVNIDDQTNKQS